MDVSQKTMGNVYPACFLATPMVSTCFFVNGGRCRLGGPLQLLLLMLRPQHPHAMLSRSEF